MSEGTLREMTVAEILSEAVALYRQHFSALVLLALVPHLLLIGLSFLLAGLVVEPRIALGIQLVPTVVLNALVLAAVVHSLCGAVAGRLPGMLEAYWYGFGRAMVSIVLAYLVVWVLVTLGFLAFVLPGLIIGGLLAPTVPAIVLERLGPVPALVRAYGMMKSSVLKGTAVFAFAIGVSGLLPLLIHIAIGPGPFSPLLIAMLGAVTQPLAYSATAVLYLSMRSAEGYTLAELRADLTAHWTQPGQDPGTDPGQMPVDPQSKEANGEEGAGDSTTAANPTVAKPPANSSPPMSSSPTADSPNPPTSSNAPGNTSSPTNSSAAAKPAAEGDPH